MDNAIYDCLAKMLEKQGVQYEGDYAEKETCDIPDELVRRCERIDELVKCVKYREYESPSLQSRQVIASIVEQWEREQLISDELLKTIGVCQTRKNLST